MSTKPEITHAFIGATGGCMNACLTHTILAGYHTAAIARNPSKLQSLLLSQGIPQSTLDSNLTIIPGDATDIEVVKRLLIPASNNGRMVSNVMSGLGSTPKFQASVTKPVTLDNPHVCENTAKTLVAAIEQLQGAVAEDVEKRNQRRPLVTIISTTGISDGPEDVPFGMRTMYHYVLGTAHEDKKKMEQAVWSKIDKSDPSRGMLRGAIVVRCTLFGGGDHLITSGKGWRALKVGTEREPTLGFSIQRADIGEWIFEEVVKTGGEKWVNEKVTLTA
ncbi:hypothetical protein FQN55_007999 [Onygenales sp. PD_40]|nr:hypothetical protein FQN55_007999 [Onygenales sp. PD_40]